MFNVKSNYAITSHLKSISQIYDEKTNEIIILCPFCDDATRKSSRVDHGHCYLSVDKPVFNCFRCGTSGSLAKLLIYTGFQDEDVLKELGILSKYSFSKDYYKTRNKKINLDTIRLNLLKRHFKFNQTFPDLYKQIIQYVYKRIGFLNLYKFLIYPSIFNNNNSNFPSCSFLNSRSELITERLINNPDVNFRYKHHSIGSSYFFQPINFEKTKNIIMTEGVFDIINLYSYNSIFNHSDSFFTAVCGKKYMSNLERLIIQELLIGEYNIHIIYDDDFKNKHQYLNRLKLLSRVYNPAIQIYGWKPSITKDTGDFPLIQEI